MQRANREIPAFDRRKGTLFSSQADPLTKGIFAFVVIFTFVGLFVIGLGIRAVMRSPGRRMVYIALLVSATLFTLGRIMDVSSLLLMYDWDTTMMQWNGVAMTSAVFYWWSEIIMYGAVLMLLWHRVASLENGHPGKGSECGKPKKILDGVLVGLFLILSLSRVALVGSLNQWYTSLRIIGVKEYKHYRNGINVSYALGHTTIVIFFLVLVDIAITAFVLRSRISSVNKRDVPIERIVFIIFPCIFILFGLRFATTTYNHIDYTDQDRDPNIPVILDLIGIIIGSSVQVVVYTVLMLLTLKPAAWGTFGDQDFFQLREPGQRLSQQRRPAEDDKASIRTT